MKTAYVGTYSNYATIKNYMLAFNIGIGHDRFPVLLKLVLLSRTYEKNFLLLDIAFKRKDQEEHRRLLAIETELNFKAGLLRDMCNGVIGKKGKINPLNGCPYCREIIYNQKCVVRQYCQEHKKTLTREEACL